MVNAAVVRISGVVDAVEALSYVQGDDADDAGDEEDLWGVGGGGKNSSGSVFGSVGVVEWSGLVFIFYIYLEDLGVGSPPSLALLAYALEEEEQLAVAAREHSAHESQDDKVGNVDRLPVGLVRVLVENHERLVVDSVGAVEQHAEDEGGNHRAAKGTHSGLVVPVRRHVLRQA